MLNRIHIDILLAVGEKGGVENVVNKNAVYLQQQGYCVRVIQFVWEGVRWVERVIPFYPLLEGRGDYTLNDFVAAYTTFLAGNKKPDIILATAWPLMTLAARMSIEQSAFKCKIISWLHAPLERYVAAGFGGAECLQKADRVFVLNEKTRQIVQAYDPAISVSIVKNPADFSQLHTCPDNNWDNKMLLFIGRLSEEKRVDTIFRAISLAKQNWRVIIIGDGDQRDELVKLAKCLHLEKQVDFHGWKKEPWKRVENVSALVLASDYEAFPLVAIESLAAGIPVISTPVDGITEIIKPGVNGFLFPHKDSAGLACILDAMASGKLPPIESEVCRESVADYEEQKVLIDFQGKLEGVLDKISVIIPCYNVEKEIARCLDSVLGQALHGVRIEIICIDDKSTDNTLHILEEYEKKYPENFMLIPLDENGKQGNARNIGMMYASGDYIAFVDADDMLASNMLQELYDKAVCSQCDIVECAYKEVRQGDPMSVEEQGIFECMDMRIPDVKKRYILQYGWKTGPWGRLYRREFLDKHVIMFPTDAYMEDIYFSELCMLHMNTYIRIPYTYYFYCINESGVMCSGELVNYYMDTAKVQNSTTDWILDQGLAEECIDEFACLHFSKAFVEPVMRMCTDERFFSYENFQYLKKCMLYFFPDFLQNPYVLGDKSEEMELYKVLLREEFSEQQLRKVMERWRKR